MFQKKFQIIIDTIKANNSLFANSGFVKDLKTGGGFKGITDEYKHYFYGYIRSEEDEDKYNFTQLDDYSCSTINVDFDFKLVFSIEGCVENFGTILMKQLNDINGVFVNGFSDETENIYKIETGKDLQSDYFNLYSFSCTYSKKTNLNNILKCIENNSISVENCVPL